MRKLLSLLLTFCLIIGLTACSGGSSEEAADTDNSAEATAKEQTEAPETDGSGSGGGTLVVYFSATGNTKAVAEKIASITGADIYEIKAAQEYTDADLDWNDSDSRTTHEQNDPSARPEIGGEDIDLSNYSTVFIGYPIWFGQEPRIMDTFVESHDFAGKKVIPFCTSGSSDIGQSGDSMAEKAGTGDWQTGKRFSGGASEDDVRIWVDSLGL